MLICAGILFAEAAVCVGVFARVVGVFERLVGVLARVTGGWPVCLEFRPLAGIRFAAVAGEFDLVEAGLSRVDVLSFLLMERGSRDDGDAGCGCAASSWCGLVGP